MTRLALRRVLVRVAAIVCASLFLGSCSATIARDGAPTPREQEAFVVSLRNDPERLQGLQTFPGSVRTHVKDSDAATKYVQRLVDRLIAASPMPERRTPVSVEDCEPMTDEMRVDGSLKICRRTVQHLGSESELAFLVAHETSHSLLRHADMDKVRTNQTREAIRRAGRFFGGHGATFSEAGSVSETAHLKRQDETEADLFGVDLMVSAGFNPTAAIGFFDLLARSKIQKAKPFAEKEETKRIGRLATLATTQSSDGSVDGAMLGVLAQDNAIDKTIVSGVDESDHDDSSQRLKLVSDYVHAHYRREGARPVGELPRDIFAP